MNLILRYGVAQHTLHLLKSSFNFSFQALTMTV
uniref:Uncharacterized protein n=1 Tax=Anguilla anguilla TaxID=7936 RepID=A0A0E9PVS8_ANGAN